MDRSWAFESQWRAVTSKEAWRGAEGKNVNDTVESMAGDDAGAPPERQFSAAKLKRSLYVGRGFSDLRSHPP